MQTSVATLIKQAINAALKAKWEEAVEINLQIITKHPTDLDAKIRLGRAYIQTKQFEKAKKVFKEVLKADPINSIALKNLEIAKEGKMDHKEIHLVDTKALLKEPGTTCEVRFPITTKYVTADSFTAGEVLPIKVKKHAIEVFKTRKDTVVEVGEITREEVVNKVNTAINREGKVCASFIRGKDKEITILLKATHPVFKAEKQDIRPYFKGGVLDDPDMEGEEELVSEN